VYKGKRIAKEGKASPAKKGKGGALFERFGKTAMPTTYEDTVLLAALSSVFLVAVFLVISRAREGTARCTGQEHPPGHAGPETALLGEYAQPKLVTEAECSEYASPSLHTVLQLHPVFVYDGPPPPRKPVFVSDIPPTAQEF